MNNFMFDKGSLVSGTKWVPNQEDVTSSGCTKLIT